MAYTTFPLFQSHLDLAHSYWERLVEAGDNIVDATCGNGHDTLKLALLAFKGGDGRLWGLDIQQQALDSTQRLLAEHLPAETIQRIHLRQQSHRSFPSEIGEASVKLVVYNLGYLPGGDKSITTSVKSTLESLEASKGLIQPGGAISITCYPGHEEGAKEQERILDLVSQWSPRIWNCTHHQWLNRRQAPSLLLIQRESNGSSALRN